MNEALLFLHFVGLMLGAAGGFASAIVMRRALALPVDEAKVLRGLGPTLANVSATGVTVLWVTGLFLVWSKWSGFASLPQLLRPRAFPSWDRWPAFLPCLPCFSRCWPSTSMRPKDTEGSNGLIRFVRRNQLVVFVILAYALSWWAWIWYRLDPGHVDAPILPIGPLLAVLIVLAMAGGWPAIKDLLRKIVVLRGQTNSFQLGPVLNWGFANQLKRDS